MTRNSAAPNHEFDQLRSLLLGKEAERIDDLAKRVEGIDKYVGQSPQLEIATAAIIAKALRRAEVERHKELANAIAPLVVSAIQSEIKNSKDMMVEALYPITGRLVAAAVAAAFRDLNARIEQLTSLEGLKLRLRGAVSGKAAGDLALAQSLPGRITRILFLERGSGVLVANWQFDGNAPNQAELVSGLIAAITEFAASALAEQGGELRTLDLGATRLILRASSRMIIAADCEGNLRPMQETSLNAAFLHLLEQHDNGSTAHDDLLAEVAASVASQEAVAAVKRPAGKGMYVLGALIAGALLWWGASHFLTARYESNLHSAFRAALANDPELAAYPLDLRIEQDRRLVTIHGLTPDLERVDAIAAGLRDAAFPRAIVLNVARVAPIAGLVAQENRSRVLNQRAQRADDQMALMRRQSHDEIAGMQAVIVQLRGLIDSALAEIHRKQASADGEIEGARQELARQAMLAGQAGTDVKASFANVAATQARLSEDVSGLARTTQRLQIEIGGGAPQVLEVRANGVQTGNSRGSQMQAALAETDQGAAGLRQQIANLQDSVRGLRSQIDSVSGTTERLGVAVEGDTAFVRGLGYANATADRATDAGHSMSGGQGTSILQQLAGLQSAADSLQAQINGVAAKIPQAEAGAIAAAETQLAVERQRLEAVGQSVDAGQARIAGIEKAIAVLQARLETPQDRLLALLDRTSIFFVRDDVLEDEQRAEEIIGQIALLMRQTNATIRIIGHADQTGSSTANVRISERRTARIAQILAEKNVEASRVISVALGSGQSGGAANWDARRLNRRVTFEIAENGTVK